MNPAHSVLLAALFAAAPITAQESLPQMTLDLRTASGAVEAKVHVDSLKFLAVVVVSLSPVQRHYFGLPPILDNFAVFGIGTTGDGTLLLRAPDSVQVPAGLPVYGQALIVAGPWMGSTGVVKLHQG